jgi:hypothetical protein
MLPLNLITAPSLVQGNPSAASALQSRSKRTRLTRRTLFAAPVMLVVNKVSLTRMVSPSVAAEAGPAM